jgi:anthranilate phosphoribosyltransferase
MDENIVDQPHKIITSSMEGMLSNESFDIGLLSQNEIEGGKTIDESAQMFTNIISGRNRGPKQRSFCQCRNGNCNRYQMFPLEGFQIAKKVYFRKGLKL